MAGVYDPGCFADLADEAEQLGFESFWLPEHLVLPVGMSGRPGASAVDGRVDDHPHVPADTPLADPLLALAHIAARTTSIRLGTAVYVPALRSPFVVARAGLTLDLLCGGRFDFGVGGGWLRAEWEAAQVPFAGRGARLDELIEIFRRPWGGEGGSPPGGLYAVGGPRLEAQPGEP